jgi:hypothetical protein
VRIQRITTNYPEYLRRFRADREGLSGRSYGDQHEALMRDGYGWADFWTTALAPLGYRGSEIVANAEPMQRRWAAERGVSVTRAGWLLEIVAAQIAEFAPDVLFVNDYFTFPAEFVREMRRRVPSIRLVLGWCGAPYRDPAPFRAYDVVLSSVPELVTHFRESGHVCHRIRHAFEPRVLERLNPAPPRPEGFGFLGSISRAAGFHGERERLLVELIERCDLRIWTDISRPGGITRVKRLLRSAAGRVLRGRRRGGMAPPVPLHPAIVARARPPQFGMAMYEQLRALGVALNTHIDASHSHASNMRLYEATGVGGCLLTDWKGNLSELFEPEIEVVTYRGAAEAAERAKFLLDHPSERDAIARAGQARVLREHTFAHRAEELHGIIEGALR